MFIRCLSTKYVFQMAWKCTVQLACKKKKKAMKKNHKRTFNFTIASLLCNIIYMLILQDFEINTKQSIYSTNCSFSQCHCFGVLGRFDSVGKAELFITRGMYLFFTLKSVTNNTKILAVAHFDTSNLLVNAMMSGTRI